MSLCLAISFDDKVYIAADSKSSTRVCKTNFEDKTKYSLPASYSYKKIFSITLGDGKQIIGCSVGDNIFERKTLTEFIKSLDFTGCSNLKDTAFVIEKKMNEIDAFFEINSTFGLFRYEDDIVKNAVIKKVKTKYEVKMENFQPEKNTTARKAAFGASWATNLSDYTLFIIPEQNETDTVYSINEIFDKAKTVGPYFDDSVGGPIHIGKLTPEGFTWLQNGYEL